MALARAYLTEAAIVIAPVAVATATIAVAPSVAIAAALVAVTTATIAVTTAAIAAASAGGLDCAHLQQGTACELPCGCATPCPPDIGPTWITHLSNLLPWPAAVAASAHCCPIPRRQMMDREHLQHRADLELLCMPQALRQIFNSKHLHSCSAILVTVVAAHNAAEATHLALGDGSNPAAAFA